MFPELAEIEAVGVPVQREPALMNANLAESVDVPPSARSAVRFPGLRTSPVSCQQLVPIPSPVQVPQVGTPDAPLPERIQRPAVSVSATLVRLPDVSVYRTALASVMKSERTI